MKTYKEEGGVKILSSLLLLLHLSPIDIIVL